MSLQLRQMMERQLIYQVSMPERSIESIQRDLLIATSQDDIGMMLTLSAELVEKVRRSDPAYGLEPYHETIARAYGEST